MRPRATPGVVDVWRIDLGDEALDELWRPGRLGGLLCARERARAARLIRERDRSLWARSRGALRMLLGRYLDRDPRRLRFELGPYGKPRLASRPGAPRRPGPIASWRPGPDDLRFNLSHSGELMLVAVTAGAEVGVDVELARARYTPGFLKQWTKREAIVKCSGTGLARARIDLDGKDAIDVDDLGAIGSNGQSAPWTAELDVGPDAIDVDDLGAIVSNGQSAPWTAELDVGPDAFGAVAVAGGPCELRRLNGAWERL